MLPRGVTPNEVWFGRTKPTRLDLTKRQRNRIQRHTETVEGGHENLLLIESTEESTKESSTEDNYEEVDLSELHQRVRDNQDQYNLRMIKKKKGVLIRYRKGQIVLLQIPKKNRKNIEPERLPCRILDIKNKASISIFDSSN